MSDERPRDLNQPMPPDRFAELARRREAKPAPSPLQPVPSREPAARTTVLAGDLLQEAAGRTLEAGELLLVSEEASLADLEAAAARVGAAANWPEEGHAEEDPVLAELQAPRLLCPRIFAITGWRPPLSEHLKMLAAALAGGQSIALVMLVGHVETLPERVEHLTRVRDLLGSRSGAQNAGGDLVMRIELAADGSLPGASASAREISEEARPDTVEDDRRHALAIARLALGDGVVHGG